MAYGRGAYILILAHSDWDGLNGRPRIYLHGLGAEGTKDDVTLTPKPAHPTMVVMGIMIRLMMNKTMIKLMVTTSVPDISPLLTLNIKY